MISNVYPIEEVEKAFESLKAEGNKPLMVILDYGKPNIDNITNYLNQDKKVFINTNPVNKDVINIALIGAGSFATGMHLPNIHKLKNQYKLYAVMNRTGHKAKAVAKQYSANYATTNYDDILNDKNIDLVLICTRHNSHAELSIKALRAGKNVFVEKPLATNQNELDKIKEFYADGMENKPILMVGFNRRFSKYAQEIKRHTDKRINPLFIHYRMNAGYIPLDHWVHENGGRIVGECCHIIDLMTFFTGCKLKSICCEKLTPKTEYFTNSDNKSIIMKYEDGSVATIEYFAVGNKKFPKEYMEVHFDEKTIVMDNYQNLKGYGINIKEIKTKISEKGHLEELQRLYETLKCNKPNWPIEFWDMAQTTEASFLIIIH